MPLTIYDVLDTTVKIGLSALISGVATYRITRLTHSNEMEKSRNNRKRELLEDISSQVEECSNATLKYWAYMIEYVRCVDRKLAISDDLKAKIDGASKELFDKFSHLSSAEGKLILIGADAAQVLTREYGEYIKEFRRSAWQGNSSLTEENLDGHRETILSKRKALYSELRQLYEK